MGLLTKVFAASPEDPKTSFQTLMDIIGIGTGTDSGILVNERTALENTVVLACVRVIAETLATLPLNVYQRLDPGKRKATEHRLYPLLHDQPNPQMSSVTLREAETAQLLLWGNLYAELQRDKAGRVVAIWPLPSDRTRPVRRDGILRYETALMSTADPAVYQVTSDFSSSNQVRYLRPEDVLHVPGLSFNGLVGMSPIQLVKQTIGLSIAAERFGALFFGNGSRPSGFLSSASALKPEARKNIEDSFREFTSRKNALKTIVLESGMTWNPLTIPPDEAQFIETRKFQISEIARIFRVPLHLVQDLERSTNNNIEQQSLEFVMHTIRPWAVRWEQELNRKLFLGSNFYAEHAMDGLLRGDFKSRMEGYAVMRNIGVFSANDILEKENMNPISEEDGGDVRLAPLNMVPLSVLANTEALADPDPANPDQTVDPGGTPADPAGMLRDRVVHAFRRLFSDAVRRTIARDKRDEKAVRQIFSPVLTAMAETVLSMNFASPKLNGSAITFIAEYAGGIGKRAGEWDVKNHSAIAEAEAERAYKAFTERVGDLQEAL